ncbi:hypothetical protein FLP41_05910 [Paracoccus marcusii]|nr:hypothetical protein FLP41_05910 [Paracoccus marcusii]
MSHDANTARHRAFDWLLHSPLALPLVGLIVVSVLMAFASDNFFTVNNILNVLRQVSVVGILAVGMTFVILTGGIDLSVGAVMALAGTVAAGIMVNMGLPGGWASPPPCWSGWGWGCSTACWWLGARCPRSS